MRLSHNGYLENNANAQRNAVHRGGRPQSRTARVSRYLQNLTLAEHEIFRRHVSTRPLHDQIHRELVHRLLQFQKRSQLFMSPHDDPLFVAMRVLVALSAVVENGYD